MTVNLSSISLRIRTLSSFLGTYWLDGLRGDGIGSMGVGCNGSNGLLGSIFAGHYRRDCFGSFPKRDVDKRWRTHLKDGSAEVFANHLNANIASGPFFSVELDRSQSLKIG